MPRCKKERKCRSFANIRVFKPKGSPSSELEDVVLELDEFEAMRLCDHDDMNQIEASTTMEVSRATVQRLLQSGRKKIVDALLHNKIIILSNELEINSTIDKQPQSEA